MRSESRATPAAEAAAGAVNAGNAEATGRARPEAVPNAAAGGQGLDALLRPRALAIIGASPDPAKRGYQIIRALQEAGYPGRIHPVNPRGGEILGLPVLRTIAEIPEATDLAVLCTPAASAPGILAECAGRGVRAAVVLALGFRESGGEGAELEARVRAVAARCDIRVLGPNTSGLLYLPLGLNLIGMRDVPAGGLALVVQSGNILLEQISAAARDGGEGFAACVGLGNMADIRWHDVLDDLRTDAHVRAIIMYGESFEHGRAFVEAAARAARVKPVALLAGGRSAAGSRAARSHTGALASGAAVMKAALCAAGVIEMARTDELRAVATALAWQPAFTGDIAILSDGGGHATLAADAFATVGAPLARLAPKTSERLRALLGPAAAVHNPVDVAGATDRNPALFADALRTLVADPGVGGVLLVGLFGGYAIRFAPSLEAAEIEAAKAMAAAARGSGRALVVHTLYHASESAALRELRRAEVPVAGSLEAACAAVAALATRGRALARPALAPLPVPGARSEDVSDDGIAHARAAGRTALLETEARALAMRHGVPLVDARFCASAEDAETAAAQLGGEVAVRVVASGVLHKTEAGGVRLRVAAANAARVFAEVRDAVELWAAGRGTRAGFEGVLVSPMLPPPVVELIVGARRDPSFGPLLALGIGGIAVEAIGDVVLRLLPATRDDVRSALAELRASSLLTSPRAGAPADLDAIADLALALGACLMAEPEIADIESNPVFACSDRAVAVDLRATLTQEAASP